MEKLSSLPGPISSIQTLSGKGVRPRADVIRDLLPTFQCYRWNLHVPHVSKALHSTGLCALLAMYLFTALPWTFLVHVLYCKKGQS